MKKQATGSNTKDQKNMGSAKHATQNRPGKSSVSNGHSDTGATSKVKSKVSHGLANEGTTGSYEAGQ